MAGKLKGRVALVSGSGRGIGREIALKLASEGARVVVNDLDADPANETAEAIRTAGGEAVVCAGSVTEDGFAERFVQTGVDSFGGLDIIVNNAGYTWDRVVQKMTDEQWHAIIDVHLTAPFKILRAAQPVIAAMAKEEAAAGKEVFRKVVNISSIAGTGGNAGQINYSAAKAGILGMTRTMAKEWGRYRVNVNAVAFGPIRTRLTEGSADGGNKITVGNKEIKVGVNPDLLSQMERMIPLGRVGTPEEAAGAVYLFCSPESNFISGQYVICGGGFTI
ncbi:SDR family NAD(P)-dependent oxidoreductase [Enterovirga aerilata]|uniref:SDR family oxidoreductase n=1 Tax=Enterovirga aerilata TaxID=2730920 RepID=A0A849I2W9_9HYPH|nr:SDR family oxidoreductase [Enterovirga sp. DB1703]NNM73742.1 SDR family oxidoreductase [Enterovirga sp. DB1703]